MLFLWSNYCDRHIEVHLLKYVFLSTRLVEYVEITFSNVLDMIRSEVIV